MILLIDGNNLAYKCRYVFNLSHAGVDVSITYGFISVLSSMLDKYKPSSVIVCWDGGIPDFRRQALPQYKANRVHEWEEGEKEDFYRQMDELCDFILPNMGIISIRHPGAEADDLLYHASRIFDDKNIIVVTSDKDLYQACTKDGKVKVLKGDELISTKEIEKYIGLPFTQLGEWRAIQGDKSDNIPGIAGVGEVTATKLLSQFGDIVGLYNAATGRSPQKALLSPKIATKVQAFGMQALIVNIVVSRLYIDRVGARLALVANMYPFPTANITILKKFFMSRAFTSLMTSNLFANIRKFRPPKIRRDVRFPVNIGRRFPVE